MEFLAEGQELFSFALFLLCGVSMFSIINTGIDFPKTMAFFTASLIGIILLGSSLQFYKEDDIDGFIVSLLAILPVILIFYGLKYGDKHLGKYYP